ncbi:hypothetical protein VB620_12765 [Nodularia harveyana UHCC-0300]|uniref:Isochorismate synthase n=1 Tax=Nodularia harveyana UHCC-0300 TaxID=2974287 RepID=A0ABU5UF78_9CYAN|nr:hypothetical protein [Nodularia harveyana]MEA5582209.1 hypothetical protein [Nodularia harveyana UHCC-0300]
MQSIINIPQQITNYISEAVNRIFSPRDDEYPATGVQPFEGDPAEKKNH